MEPCRLRENWTLRGPGPRCHLSAPSVGAAVVRGLAGVVSVGGRGGALACHLETRFLSLTPLLRASRGAGRGGAGAPSAEAPGVGGTARRPRSQHEGRLGNGKGRRRKATSPVFPYSRQVFSLNL
jgi:hypothetical protein